MTMSISCRNAPLAFRGRDGGRPNRLILCILVVGMLSSCRSSDSEPQRREGPSDATGRSAWRPGPVAVYGREIGTSHPIVLIEAASNGRWVVACEARGITAEGAEAVTSEH